MTVKSYIRSDDGATMVAVADHEYVNAKVGYALGLVASTAESKPATPKKR